MKKKPAETGFDDSENRFDDSENETVGDAIGEETATVYTLPYPVRLTFPFEFGDEKITEIKIKFEPDVECMSHIPVQGQKMGHMIPVVAHCSGQFMEVIKKLKMKDFNACMEVINSFL